MKKIKFSIWAIMLCMLPMAFVSCNNESEVINGVVDQQTTDTEVTTRSGDTFRVLTLSAGQSLYRANQTGAINWSALRNEPVVNDDWANGLYFFDQDIRNYLDSDHPYFIKSTLKKPFRVIDTDYEGFMSEYNMAYVVAKIEVLVGSSKPAGRPFLLWLGDLGYGFRYYENIDREVAVVIPHALLTDDLFSQQVIAMY